jgi:hypothetical protein
MSLKCLCFKNVRSQEDRLLGLGILFPHGLTDKAKELFAEPCIKKKVEIEASDRYGIKIELKLSKSSGTIWILVHKKRNFYLSVSFRDNNKTVLWSDAFEEHTDEGIMKINDKFKQRNYELFMTYNLLIQAFHYKIRHYIDHSMSRKWNTMKRFIDRIFDIPKKDFTFKGHMTTTYT